MKNNTEKIKKYGKINKNYYKILENLIIMFKKIKKF